ncbi:glutamine-hydrolyzing GMP synthase [Candidatus Woesearchaeota archaeon]|nr:glutamine-hydrolyzing GMP synthase [Candidatus Woesearchaeota archaeon]
MILVIDFGGQYAHLICRRIRQLNVYSEIRHHSISAADVKKLRPAGIIFSGGPASVYYPEPPLFEKKILSMGVPILGICYGHQIIAKVSGGRVITGGKEYGKGVLKPKKSPLFKGLGKKEQVWLSHGDSVVKLPRGYSVIGSTERCKTAAYANEKKRVYGIQFHPEVQHTPNGMRILANFIKICGAKRNYSIKGLPQKIIGEIRKQIGDNSVIVGVSGGVDSLVASILIKKATPKVYCVYIDHGLVRKGETEYVKGMYKRLGFRNFYAEDASKIFLSRLKGVADPEKKRKIIGNTFIEVFEKKVRSLKKAHGAIKFLGQGTIYPDRIESAKASSAASVIKTHHNVGGLPAKMKLKLLEPLKELYKDEVRAVGKELGIPREYLARHPFPGPGLAVRIIGEVTPDKIEMVREADAIFISKLIKYNCYDRVWQALAALLPVKTVGVMGDSRTYGYVIALRAVTSKDAMTADWARLPNIVLEESSTEIINSIKGVNRVVYDISQKPPSTIEYE